MELTCACSSCGFANRVGWSQAGRSIACQGCGRGMTVPVPCEPADAMTPSASTVRFRCPACNRKFATRADLAGRKIRCSGCGSGVRVPEQGQEATADPSRPVLKTVGATEPVMGLPRPSGARAPSSPMGIVEAAPASPLFDEPASIEGIEPSRRAGTVLPSRSEAMEQVRHQVAEQAAVAQEKAEKAQKARKKKKKRKKSASDLDAKETLKLVAGVGAFVGVLTLVAYGYPDFRFPLGGLLCIVGFITYLLGITSLRQLVAEEGAFQALLFRFCPPYQWWFVATRWGETKDFVAFFGAGLMILSLGSAVIKTSPVGKEAEAADRAYKKARLGERPAMEPPPVAGKARPGGQAAIPPDGGDGE